MSRKDAYGGEMDFLRRLTAEDEERLIAGDAPDGGELADVAAFTSTLRSSLSSQTLPPASGAFVVRLAEIARASAETIEEPQRSRPARPRRRLALVARVAVAVATVPLLFAGLAFAGVSLPGPADEAFESIGVELPNQAADADDDTEGTAKDGDSAGSATGQENSAGKLGHGRDKAKQGKALGLAKNKNKGRPLGKRDLAPGEEIAESKRPDTAGSGSSNAGGNSGSAGSSSGGGGDSSGKAGRGSAGASGSTGGGSPQGQARGLSN